MDSRRSAAANAVASVRLEGLEPSTEILEVLDRWVDGELSTRELEEVATRVAQGEPTTASASPHAA